MVIRVAVIDVINPPRAATPAATRDIRGTLEPVGQRSSSMDALGPDPGGETDDVRKLAALLGASERALRTAQAMLGKHLATAGKGNAGSLTVTLDGIRRTELTAPGLVAQASDDEGSVGVALAADPLVMLIVGGRQRALHWTLLRGGPSVTARADALRLIRSLATGGRVTVRLGRDALPALEVEGGLWELEDEWRLFEDLATLTEWSGVDLPMPALVSARDATVAAQAAGWIRSQRIDARITDTIAFEPGPGLDTQPEQIRLHQDFGVHVLATEIPLGEGVARVTLAGVDRPISQERVYRARPLELDVAFSLLPPAGRRLPARRTQAPHVKPPSRDSTTAHSSTRSARRTLADVLAARRSQIAPMPAGIGSSSQLLDDVRGE